VGLACVACCWRLLVFVTGAAAAQPIGQPTDGQARDRIIGETIRDYLVLAIFARVPKIWLAKAPAVADPASTAGPATPSRFAIQAMSATLRFGTGGRRTPTDGDGTDDFGVIATVSVPGRSGE
jgi:hypothetical protein